MLAHLHNCSSTQLPRLLRDRREVADIVCSFPEQLPCVVLSAMGKTTNNLLAAGAAAASLGDVEAVIDIPAFQEICRLHEDTCDQLR